MLKNYVAKLVGPLAWQRLGQFRIEYRMRKVQNFMDSEIYEATKDLLPAEGYYVDVGAHDGRSFSNTYHLEKSGWSGLLIEPIVSKYFRMREIRSHTNNVFVNAACVSKSFKESTVELQYGDLMTFAPSISILDQNSWTEGAKNFFNSNEHGLPVWAPAKTLTSILKESATPKEIQFLSVDVEGAELEVLNGCDFDQYSFNLICIESYSPESILNFFSDKPYVLVAHVSSNLVFVKNNSSN